MARQLRVEFEGAIYHLTCRMLGDVESVLFTDDADRKRFIERLSERVEQYNIRLYMFVLMRNHYHLVFETPEGNCSKFMQSLSTAYTVYYNLRHDRHGHLFDGRYKAKLVDGDDYLLALSRYVHLNPVKVAGIKSKLVEEKIRYLREYPWSSYPGYIRKRSRFDFVEYAPVLGEMRGKEREWSKRYQKFVESGLAENDDKFIEILKESPRCIGGLEFREWVDERCEQIIAERSAPEDVSFRRVEDPLNPDVVLARLAQVLQVDVDEFRQRRRNSPLRAIASNFLIKYSGLSQREVATVLNVGSGSAISRQLLRYRKISTEDKKLNKLLMRCESSLKEDRIK